MICNLGILKTLFFSLSLQNSLLYSALQFIFHLVKYQLLHLDEKFEFSYRSKEKYEKLRKEAL